MTMTTTPTCCCWRVPHAATARGRTGPAATREAKPQELDFSCPPPSGSDWWTRMVGWLLLSEILLQGRRLQPLFPRERWQDPAVTSVSPLRPPLGFALWRDPGTCPGAASTQLLGSEAAGTGLSSAGCGVCHGAGMDTEQRAGGTVSPCHLCLASRAASQLALSTSWWGTAGPSSADLLTISTSADHQY